MVAAAAERQGLKLRIEVLPMDSEASPEDAGGGQWAADGLS